MPRKVSTVQKRPDGTPVEHSTIVMVDAEVPQKITKHYQFTHAMLNCLWVALND